MNNYNELISECLNFLEEIVYSGDLTLTISYEQLHQNLIIKMIRKNIIKKALELFNSVAEKN
jgi:molecular chaperone HtpG